MNRIQRTKPLCCQLLRSLTDAIVNWNTSDRRPSPTSDFSTSVNQGMPGILEIESI